MKKNIYKYARLSKIFLVMMTCMSFLVLSACGKNQETVSNEELQEQGTESKSESKAQEESADAAEATSKEKDSDVVAVSSLGYDIRLVDGVTYVNGILIANKTYGLPSSYGPGDIDPEVKKAFEVMQKAATAQGLNIYISSGFRSYNYQQRIYNNYVAKDGVALADTYSARAGYSEHQSGLCFDLNSIDDSFAATPEGKWVAEHAHEYGFIIRYPKGKEDVTGYQYESWHLRYLGVETATAVYQSGLCLEEYLGITSSYK